MAILEWQNLVFLLPMGAGLLYVVLMASGLALGHGEMDMDHDVGVDLGHDVAADVDHDVGADLGHDADAGHAGHIPHLNVLGSVLSLLGVGRVPISILFLSACFLWGASGLLLNAFFGVNAMGRVICLAALATVVGMRLVAEGIAAVMPGEESYHTLKEELVGHQGEVLYTITHTSGAVRIFDPSGNLQDLACRTRQENEIPAGSRVVLDAYDPAADLFYVRPCD